MKGPGSLLSAGDPRLAPVSPSIKSKENKLIEKPGHRDAGKWPKSTHVALISRDPRLSSPAGRHQRLFPDTLLPKQEGAPSIQPIWILRGSILTTIGQDHPDEPGGRTEAGVTANLDFVFPPSVHTLEIE